MSLLKYYGGKSKLIKYLLELMPYNITHYVEVFGGAANLLLSKPPSEIEVYNDINHGLVNLFRVIRNKDLFPEFKERLELVPYSRKEFFDCRDNWETETDPIEKAIKYFICLRMSFSGIGKQWSYDKCKRSCINGYLNSIKLLPEIHKRLQKVFIECDTFDKIIDRFDSPDYLFYCDPPYLPNTRVRPNEYKNEMSNKDHKLLIEKLLNMESMVMLSGYDNDVYRPLVNNGWDVSNITVCCGVHKYTKVKRIETVWRNPQLMSRVNQFSFL